MARKIFQLQYSWGNSGYTGHVTYLGKDRYLMSLEDYGRITHQRELHADNYREFIDGIYDRFEQPEWDFDSVFAFARFVKFGRFDVDPEDEYLLELS